MKSIYKPGWKASSQSRKQIKFRANAPKHIASHFLHSQLSKELRKKHGKRSLRVRKGDEVRVLRGSFKGSIGVVDKVHTSAQRVLIRGVELTKHDGSKRPYPVAVSNIQIIKLVDDKRRL